MWDTIEHLRRPDLYVEKIASLTEPGALLTITTGDVQSLVARARGSKWRMIIPPVHLHFFSTDTLASLLNNYGFDVIYNRYCGYYRGAANVAYIILTQHRNQQRLVRSIATRPRPQLGLLSKRLRHHVCHRSTPLNA
jgi:hypothetical protein